MPGASRATVAMAAMTVQAPVLSIFISSIRSDGLMLMPPESKQTPLPTIARCRSSESRSPFPPERMTIIRGGLSLPWPTAMNMPIPSSVARSGSMTSIHRPCCSAMAPRLVGEDLGRDVVGRPIGERPGGVGALADDHAALGGLRERAASPPGATRISSSSVGGADSVLVAVDRLGVVRALDDAARHELGDEPRRRRRAASTPASGASQTASARTGRPPRRRSAAAADAHDDLAIELRRPRPRRPPAGGRPAARRRGESRRVALAGQLLEVGQGPELPAGSPVQLVERTLEGRVPHDGDDEDVGLDVPGLVGDDTKLHGGVDPPGGRAASGAPAAAISEVARR